MGMPASKFGQEIEQEEPTQGSLPSTPILTPKTRFIDLDPRSPSDNIIRTPIEVLLAKHKETKCIKNQVLLSGECCDNNKYSVERKLKNIDPRSPTIDFERTPIVVADNDAVLPRKLHNKNLDNVRRTLETSPTARPLKKSPSQRITSPKLLESNLIKARPCENKRKSYVGLLETNLDYVETDLDNVKPVHKISENEEDGFTISSDLEENADIDVVNNTISHAEILEKCPVENEDLKATCSSDKPDMNSLEKEKAAQTLEIVDIPTREIPKASKMSSNHLEVDDDDGLLAIVSHKSTAMVEHKVKPDHDKQENRLKEENLRDFDKKLRNLIYEDKEKLGPMINDKKVNEYKSRVPLGTRNVNMNMKKSISRLKVHDRPQKSNNEFSRIPVFQSKKGKCKLNQQCENTPPRNVDDNLKPKKLQWDPDNTLII